MEPTQIAAVNHMLSLGLALVFYITLLVLLFYSLFLAYHWFSYGTSKKTSLISLVIFLAGTIPFVIIMAITL